MLLMTALMNHQCYQCVLDRGKHRLILAITELVLTILLTYVSQSLVSGC